VVGFLGTRASGDDPQLLTALRRGLKEVGYVEGQNVAVEYRFAENQYDRLPTLAADLVRRQVAVIVANGRAAQAAKEATARIPIVFVAGFDPVEVGLVASMSRPGGNITGVSILDVELGPKRLQLLHELVPAATIIAVLVNPADPARAETTSKELQAAAHTLGLQPPPRRVIQMLVVTKRFEVLERDRWSVNIHTLRELVGPALQGIKFGF